MVVQRDERAAERGERGDGATGSARRRDGIITCLFYEEIRRLDPGVRAGARRARACSSSRFSIRRFSRCPRSTTCCSSGWSRSTRRGWCCYAACATLGSVAGCLVLYYVGRKGGEAFVRKRFSGDTRRPGARARFAALRRDGGADPVAAAAAGAVQDLRAARRRRRHQRRRGSRPPSRSAAASGTSAKGCSRSGTATGRWPSCARTARPSSLVGCWSASCVVPGFGGLSCSGSRAREPTSRNADSNTEAHAD